MRYIQPVSYGLAAVTAFALGCGKEQPSALENKVAAATINHNSNVAYASSDKKELDLSTPEKAVSYFITNRTNLEKLKVVLTPELYEAFEKQEMYLRKDPNFEKYSEEMKSLKWRIAETKYENADSAKVKVEYTAPDGKNEKDVEQLKKVGNKWLINST